MGIVRSELVFEPGMINFDPSKHNGLDSIGDSKIFTIHEFQRLIVFIK